MLLLRRKRVTFRFRTISGKIYQDSLHMYSRLELRSVLCLDSYEFPILIFCLIYMCVVTYLAKIGGGFLESSILGPWPQVSIEAEGQHLVQTALAPTDTEA